MYTPKAFEVTDLPMLQAAMKQGGLATLITTTHPGSGGDASSALARREQG